MSMAHLALATLAATNAPARGVGALTRCGMPTLHVAQSPRAPHVLLS